MFLDCLPAVASPFQDLTFGWPAHLRFYPTHQRSLGALPSAVHCTFILVAVATTLEPLTRESSSLCASLHSPPLRKLQPLSNLFLSPFPPSSVSLFFLSFSSLHRTLIVGTHVFLLRCLPFASTYSICRIAGAGARVSARHTSGSHGGLSTNVAT